MGVMWWKEGGLGDDTGSSGPVGAYGGISGGDQRVTIIDTGGDKAMYQNRGGVGGEGRDGGDLYYEDGSRQCGVVMLIWDLKESEPSRMTPRLFTWGGRGKLWSCQLRGKNCRLWIEWTPYTKKQLYLL